MHIDLLFNVSKYIHYNDWLNLELSSKNIKLSNKIKDIKKGKIVLKNNFTLFRFYYNLFSTSYFVNVNDNFNNIVFFNNKFNDNLSLKIITYFRDESSIKHFDKYIFYKDHNIIDRVTDEQYRYNLGTFLDLNKVKDNNKKMIYLELNNIYNYNYLNDNKYNRTTNLIIINKQILNYYGEQIYFSTKCKIDFFIFNPKDYSQNIEIFSLIIPKCLLIEISQNIKKLINYNYIIIDINSNNIYYIDY